MIEEKLRKSELSKLRFDRLMGRIEEAGKLATKAADSNDKDLESKAAEMFMDAFAAIEYNLTPLTPFFYQGLLRGEPLSFTRRPYAWDMFGMNFHGFDVMMTARQVAKSTIICCREDMRLSMWPGYKAMVLTPYPDQIKTLADRYKETAEANIFRQNRPKIRGVRPRENLYYREYGSGTAVKFGYALTSNEATRGNSADSLTVDECLDRNTLVHVPGKAVKVVDLRPGDPVIGFDEKNQIQIDTVVRIVPKGERHCWTIETEDGERLTATSNERLWTSKGWAYLSQLVADEEAAICARAVSTRNSRPVFAQDLSGIQLRKIAKSDTIEDVRVKSVTYAGMRDVWDVETQNHHTLFAGGIAVHNCQNFDASLLPAIDYVLDASPRPSRLFTGTSLTTDTLLEYKYQESSKGTMHVKCPHCTGLWLNMGDVEVCHSIIRPAGPTCPNCGNILDTTYGEIVHADQELYDLGMRGIHVPKLIIPEHADVSDPKVMPKWNKLYQDFISGNITSFNQEALGIAQSDGTREITIDDLKDICVLDESTVKAKAKRKGYQFVVSACDWGGSDYNPRTKTKKSYTVHVMLGRNINGTWEIFHIKQYAGNSYDAIAGDVLTNHILYNGDYIVTDRGGGDLYNNLFRQSGKIPYHKHWAVNYTVPNTAFIAMPKASDYNLANLVMMNKMESLTSLFNTVKRRERLFCYQWERCKDLLGEFCNIIRVPQDSDLGASQLKFHKDPKKTDDVVQALNIGLHMGRVIYGEPVSDDARTLSYIRTMATLSTSGRGAGGIGVNAIPSGR